MWSSRSCARKVALLHRRTALQAPQAIVHRLRQFTSIVSRPCCHWTLPKRSPTFCLHRSWAVTAAQDTALQESEPSVATGQNKNAEGTARGTARPATDDVLRLTCESLSTTGKGVCRTDSGFVVFVPRAVPGETVELKIGKVGQASAEGVKVKTITESPFKVEPQCRHFNDCGGCSHQDVEYEKQVQEKHDHVVQALKRIGKFPMAANVMLPPVKADKIYHYRNKMTFTAQTDNSMLETKEVLIQQPKTGLFSHKTKTEIVDITDCKLQDETANEIFLAAKAAIPGIQERGTVIVKRIMVRKGFSLDGKLAYMLVFFVTAPFSKIDDGDEEVKAQYASLVPELKQRFPSLGTISETREIAGREKAFPRFTKLHGEAWHQIEVNGLQFRVHALAFFQTNTEQAGKLVDMVYKAAGLRKGETLTDLYCGVGLFGVSCAVRAERDNKPLKRLQATDINNKATQLVKKNAELNGLVKIDMKKIKSCDLEQQTLGQSVRTHVVIVDPARAGLSKPVLHYLLRCQARTVIYVSCDAATQARDLKVLCDVKNVDAFRLESVQICDMFPQTTHVESVAVLQRVKKFDPNASEKNTYVKNKGIIKPTPSDRLMWADDM